MGPFRAPATLPMAGKRTCKRTCTKEKHNTKDGAHTPCSHGTVGGPVGVHFWRMVNFERFLSDFGTP